MVYYSKLEKKHPSPPTQKKKLIYTTNFFGEKMTKSVKKNIIIVIPNLLNSSVSQTITPSPFFYFSDN
jgi:hypothetical protein